MHIKKYFFVVFLFFGLIGFMAPHSAIGQVTTAAIKGRVVDRNGKPLPGANVVAIHMPSGTRRGTSTRSNGRFNLPNLRIGGPYKVIVSFVGYKKQNKGGIYLSLGKTETVNFQLTQNVSQLMELTVTAGNEDINDSRTGAATTIQNAQIKEMPTISRSEKDIYQLSPSSDGRSFAGRNDQFNNFSLDGSIFNNPFGLDAATPGGQSSAQPISLDAIDQIKVSVAPYDVTQSGFTGASVNAVTKSGTNTFKGSVFGYYRNQDFTGSRVEGNDIFVPDLRQYQTGFSLGGPIIKDKLFFFVNFELDLRNDLASNFLANNPNRSGSNISRVKESDLMTVSNLLEDRYSYETGSYEQFKHDTDNNKGIVKIDWNINKHNSLTATFNYLDAFQDHNAHPTALGRRGPDKTTLQFANSGYRINNEIQSGIVELRSSYGSKFSNKLQLGYTHFNDFRNPFSAPFPVVNIAKNGIRYIVAGHEPFSIHNRLDQKVLQATDNFDFFAGNHTLTFGSSLEAFLFDNSFNLGAYFTGQPGGTFSGAGFKSVQAFVDYVKSGKYDSAVKFARDTFKKNSENNSWDLAEANLGQWAIYGQDKWALSDEFTLTYGLRVNFPLYFNTADKVREDIARKGGTLEEGGTYAPNLTYYDENGDPVKFNSTKLPSKKPLVSPRLGFNWDVNGDQTLQLRGGSGLFAGRLPFVWVENQVANTGYTLYEVSDPDFQFPQIWRSNLGIDKALPGGWLLSTDLTFTKDINAVLVRNFGLKAPSGRLKGSDNRKYYLNSDRAKGPNGNPTNAYVFDNANKGRSINWTVKVKKQFSHNFFASLAYNYLDSQDLNSIEAEISSDAFNRNPARGNVNKPELAPSIYGNKHRIVGNAYKTFDYGKGKWASKISLFFQYAQGGRFSYTYSGDANNDGSGLNDLIYIPTQPELADYTFTGNAQQQQAQRQAFNNFIEQDDYLSSRRGHYAEKYAILSPWYSQFDVRFAQDLKLGENTLQFSINILNVGNMINSNWGVRQHPTNTQPVGISVDPKTQQPVYSFDQDLNDTFTNSFNLESRWRLQFGIRYSFH